MEQDRLAEVLLDFAHAPGSYAVQRGEPPELHAQLEVLAAWALGRVPSSLSSQAEALRNASIMFIQRACFAPGATHYQVLGLSETEMTAEQLRPRYRAMIRLTHPDMGVAGLPPDAAGIVNRAHEVLGDEAQRRRYDEQLAAKRTAPPPAPPPPGFAAMGPPSQPRHVDLQFGWGERWRSLMARYPGLASKSFTVGSLSLLAAGLMAWVASGPSDSRGLVVARGGGDPDHPAPSARSVPAVSDLRSSTGQVTQRSPLPSTATGTPSTTAMAPAPAPVPAPAPAPAKSSSGWSLFGRDDPKPPAPAQEKEMVVDASATMRAAPPAPRAEPPAPVPAPPLPAPAPSFFFPPPPPRAAPAPAPEREASTARAPAETPPVAAPLPAPAPRPQVPPLFSAGPATRTAQAPAPTPPPAAPAPQSFPIDVPASKAYLSDVVGSLERLQRAQRQNAYLNEMNVKGSLLQPVMNYLRRFPDVDVEQMNWTENQRPGLLRMQGVIVMSLKGSRSEDSRKVSFLLQAEFWGTPDGTVLGKLDLREYE